MQRKKTQANRIRGDKFGEVMLKACIGIKPGTFLQGIYY